MEIKNFKDGLIAILFIGLSAIIRGFVLTKLWMWFIIPIFNLPNLILIHAIGILIILNFIFQINMDDTGIPIKNKYYENIFLYKALNALIVRPLFALVFGWVASQFM